MPPRKTASSATPTATPEISGFEQDFGRFCSIVERLEGGNLPLEEMLKLYEEGMTLSQELNTTLSAAELQVKKLSMVHEEMTANVIHDVEEENDDIAVDDDDEDPF